MCYLLYKILTLEEPLKYFLGLLTIMYHSDMVRVLVLVLYCVIYFIKVCTLNFYINCIQLHTGFHNVHIQFVMSSNGHIKIYISIYQFVCINRFKFHLSL